MNPRPIDYESIALPLRHTSTVPTSAGTISIISPNDLKVNINFYVAKLPYQINAAALVIILRITTGETFYIACSGRYCQRKEKQKQAYKKRAERACCFNADREKDQRKQNRPQNTCKQG